MTRRYVIPQFLLQEIAKEKGAQLRSALRMFFWFKTHGHLAWFKRRELAGKIPFTLKQQSKYFRILLEYGIIGRDYHGKIYLRGRRWLFHISGKGSKMAGVVVEPWMTETADGWKDFICGSCVLSTQRNIQKFATKVLVRIASTQQSCASKDVNSKGSSLSLENVAQSHNVSLSTASRWIKRAHARGLLRREHRFKDMSHLFDARSRQDVRLIAGGLRQVLPPAWKQRELPCDPAGQYYSEVVVPSALLWKDGKIVMQLPNFIENTGITFRSISNVPSVKRWN